MAISVLPTVKLNQRQKQQKQQIKMCAAKAFLVHMTISTLANYNMHTHVSSTRCVVHCALCKMRENFYFLQTKNLNKITVIVVVDVQPTNNEI